MANIKSVCVFCGSRDGKDAVYAEAAEALGKALGEREIELVYGGGSVGLMGRVASATIAAEGRAFGVIPRFLQDREVGKEDLTELLVVEDMHTRKRRMFERADAFVVLPGGTGTLDETMEILTWKQLQLHAKPVVLLNVDGFWNPLIDLMNAIVDHSFASEQCLNLFQVANSVPQLFEVLADYPEPLATEHPQRF